VAQLRFSIAIDEAWENSYWSEPPEDVWKVANDALGHLRRQFPEVEFFLEENIRAWDSPKIPPSPVAAAVARAPRGSALAAFVLACLHEWGVNLDDMPEDKEVLLEEIAQAARERRAYQLGFLVGRIQSLVKEAFGRDLTNKYQPAPGEIVLGFTGQLFQLDEGGAEAGFALSDWRVAVFPLNPTGQLLAVILHEIGHILGAEHTKGEGALMVPYLGKSASVTLEFDPENLERMRQYLGTLPS
jgi:hypothetical protein